MSIPITRNKVSAQAEQAIRNNVRAIASINRPDGVARLVTPADSDALLDFFSIPEVSGPIYTIEKPVTRENVAAHIREKRQAQARGEGLLTAVFGEDGRILSFMDHLIWPEWSAAEFGGAMRPERQSKGQGRAGIVSSIDWVFEVLGVNLLCFTAALDNQRSIRLIDAMGLRQMGEIISQGPNGTTRPSRVWEMTNAEWQEQKARLMHGDNRDQARQ